jgi:hypothetical protein
MASFGRFGLSLWRLMWAPSILSSFEHPLWRRFQMMYLENTLTAREHEADTDR